MAGSILYVEEYGCAGSPGPSSGTPELRSSYPNHMSQNNEEVWFLKPTSEATAEIKGES